MSEIPLGSRDALPFFVYGTLMQNQPNHRLLGTPYLVQPATVDGFRMVSLGSYPMAMPCEDAYIVGELVWVTQRQFASVLSRVDHLEGYSPGSSYNLYERLTVTAICEGEQHDALIYVASDRSYKSARNYPLVESGSWLEHLKMRGFR